MNNDLISRQAVLDVLNKHSIMFGYHLPEEFHEVKEEIRGLPSAQPEQKTGEWIDGHRSRWDGTFHWFRKCNQCDYEREDDNSDKDTIFCPNCGARMM